ncbi:hypothetical protein U9M48_010656 [Paspalum notatum var. saurae]|uniref:Uncharacterized protein n=1 Tax=Paspalum notatum var. saurae TaxID=547442 RepID=A0AAQ3SU33_PASNO
MSACDRLLAANIVVSWSRSNDGGGSLPSTLVESDTSPSSLPSSTAYDGPPACANRSIDGTLRFWDRKGGGSSSKA